MRLNRFGPPARGRGFTLIEMMVALGIGMLLTIIIAEVFLQTRRGYMVQDDQARVQENARFIVQSIGRVVRQAGYHTYAGLPGSTYFPYATAPAITGTDGIITGGSDSVPDQITVRFQGSGNGAGTADNTMFDCLGNTYDFGVTGQTTYAIRAGSDGNGLFCTKDDLSGTPTWQELVPGVENMQILYGVDTDKDRNANVYVRISDMANVTGATVDNIVSARFSLLVRSPTNTSPTVNSNTYTLNGSTIAAANDNRIRRVVNFTVNLRNRTP